MTTDLDLLPEAVRALVQKSLEFGPPSSTRVRVPRAKAAPKPKPIPRPALNPNVKTEAGCKIHNQIIDIALCLPGWEYDSISTHCAENRSNLHDKRGRGIHICANEYNAKGRWTISGCYPQAKDGYMFNPHGRHGWTVPGITCTTKKSAQQVARDITRRFLPDYVSMWDKLAAERDNHDQVERDAADTMNALAEAGHAEVHKPMHRGSYPTVSTRFAAPGWKAVYHYHGDIEIKITDLTPAQAEQIAALLLEWRKTK